MQLELLFYRVSHGYVNIGGKNSIFKIGELSLNFNRVRDAFGYFEVGGKSENFIFRLLL